MVLYDSPGFESDNEIRAVENLITQKNNSLNEGKNGIHCVFYVLNKSCERTIQERELPLIAKLIRQSKDIFIIITHAENEENSEEFIEAVKIQIMQNTKDNESFKNLKDIFTQLNSKILINIKDLD